MREVYERAIANVPPAAEKRYWQRYIYLWINYALWEELEAEDPARTREVYKACLDLMPHKAFTFAKVRHLLLIAVPISQASMLPVQHSACILRVRLALIRPKKLFEHKFPL